MQVSIGGRQQTVNIGGTIDRFDAATDSATGEPCLRVIDYKTGKEATLAIKDIDMLFANKNIYKSHSNYFLQASVCSTPCTRDGACGWDLHGPSTAA